MAYVTLLGIFASGDLAPSLPQTSAKQIDWPAGLVDSIDLYLVDEAGNPVLLNLGGGDSVTLSVAQGQGQGQYFTLTGTAVADNRPGVYTFGVSRVNTIDLVGRLVYDVWATLGGASRQVVAPSYFNVTPRYNP